MGLKRKASDTLSPCSPFTSSLFVPSSDTPPSTVYWSTNPREERSPFDWQSPEPYYASGMLASSPFSPAASADHCHLNSRTRKRVRNNRPNEDVVHEKTLSKLYAAQRTFQHVGRQSTPHMPPTPSPSPSPTSLSFDDLNVPTSLHGNCLNINSLRDMDSKAQTSLHAFFNSRTSTNNITSTTTTTTFKSSHPPMSGLKQMPQYLEDGSLEAAQANGCAAYMDMMDIDERCQHKTVHS